ncbi:Gfo/Idh/MocA family protein [Sphingomonas floccifaciens]|uniref:Gfo/Idh/MocA family protein n=1 Tax=Sphingomonas floccifaciens TaxID=1844115 RepID=A0ABW4N9P9_9SPHN
MKVAIVGFGKIARDQHVPAIANSGAFELAATASRHAHAEGLPAYPDIEALLAAEPDIAAIALCQPPQVRHAAARAAIAAGRHVFLEKPPGATLSEVVDLARAADDAGVTLFASWHSRFAAGVESARDWLAGRTIRSIRIDWKEDVRHWHPGQQWIWEPGGLGVFDPGINALSILTRLLRGPVRLEAATLEFPANRDAPIAATLAMRTTEGAPIAADFDWRQTGPQTWDIVVETDAGMLRLAEGGNRLFVDGVERPLPAEGEYPALYARFARLVADGRSDVDVAPLRLVADAFLAGRRTATAAFED